MDENRVQGTARKLVGRVQQEIGRAEGDLGKQVKGQFNEAVGAAQDKYGQAKDTARDATTSLDHWFRHTTEAQPYMIALAVLGVGWLLGRMSRPL
jgi:uncharacterized protein YjbJ (UPF0337 family)